MFLANLGINLVTLGCVGIAAYLIMNDKEGWGWFLFLAFCCAGTYTLRKGE